MKLVCTTRGSNPAGSDVRISVYVPPYFGFSADGAVVVGTAVVGCTVGGLVVVCAGPVVVAEGPQLVSTKTVAARHAAANHKNLRLILPLLSKTFTDYIAAGRRLSMRMRHPHTSSS
jgi:hypothetical protein